MVGDIADVYAAGEEPIAGAERDDLVEGLTAHGHRGAHALTSPDHLAATIDTLALPGDFVVCLGAGTITAWAAALPNDLAALRSGRRVAQ